MFICQMKFDWAERVQKACVKITPVATQIMMASFKSKDSEMEAKKLKFLIFRSSFLH